MIVKEERPAMLKWLDYIDSGKVCEWIDKNTVKIKSFNNKHTSYDLKHIFEKSENGFYISNDMFKQTMLRCGFKVKDILATNWIFNISEKSKCFKGYFLEL
jgi:hypothetical protein